MRESEERVSIDLSTGGSASASGVGGGGIQPAPGSRLAILEAMVDGARGGLCILNPKSTLLHSNQVAGELLGFDPRKAAGLPVHELGVDRDFDWSIGGEVAAGRLGGAPIQPLGGAPKVRVPGGA